MRNVRIAARWNASPRFAVVSEVGGSFIDYLDADSELDSREHDLLLGVAWEATAKTSGELKVGVINKDFHQIGAKSLHADRWSIRVNWDPKPHSRFSFDVSREAEESGSADGGGVIIDTFGMSWRHALSDRLRFESQTTYSISAPGAGASNAIFSLTSGLTYQIRRWLALRAGYDFSRRFAAAAATLFDDHIVTFALETRFDRGL